MTPNPLRGSPGERGVTLIELLIAITLVSMLSVGMLMSMRTGLLTLEKVDARLQSNRRVMGVERILANQIGGLIPALGTCGSPQIVLFGGDSTTLRMVSSYSIAGGARGSPEFLEFQVVPADGDGVRLIVNEYPWGGPPSIGSFCDRGLFRPVQVRPDSFVLADHLAYCRFVYQELVPEIFIGGNWFPKWDRPELPAAVRVEMESLVPDPARLPLVPVTVPIHINRDFLRQYVDEFAQ